MDTKSSLPVKTLNNDDVQVQITDGTISSQKLKVNADGALNVTDNGGSLTVDATDLDIRDLDSATDSVEVLQASHDNLNANANIQVGNADVTNANPVPMSDAGGSLTVDAVDLDIRDLDLSRDSVKIGDTTGDLLEVNTDGTINTRLLDPNGAPYTLVNPLAVVVTDDKGGDEVCDYKTTAAVAAGSNTAHSYTVTVGKTLLITQVLVSGSGFIKAVLSVGASEKFALFNSVATPNIPYSLASPIKVAAGTVVTITITNMDENPFDVYSTLFGQEI